MYPNTQQLVDSFKQTIEREREFDSFVMESLKPPAGPYAIFYHHGHLLERLQDVSYIIERMGRARIRISVLNEREYKLKPKKGFRAGVPLPKKVQVISRECHRLTRQMRLDNETLYIFSNMALDQLGYTIAFSLGLDEPERYDFQYLVTQLQSKSSPKALHNFKAQYLTDALWLYYQLRFYRNNFIEHVRRPWQRGNTMTTFGSDFNFFIPTPPGWIPQHKEDEMINSIRHLAPQWLKNLPENHWQKKRPKALLEATYKEINLIPNQVDREKVWNVWKELGGSVVSFDELGRRLSNFMDKSLLSLLTYMKASPKRINIGSTPHID